MYFGWVEGGNPEVLLRDKQRDFGAAQDYTLAALAHKAVDNVLVAIARVVDDDVVAKLIEDNIIYVYGYLENEVTSFQAEVEIE